MAMEHGGDTQDQPTVIFVVAMGGLGGPVKRLATLLPWLHDTRKILIKPSSKELDGDLAANGGLTEHVSLRRSALHDRIGAAQIAVAIFRATWRYRRENPVIHANGLVEFALAAPTALTLRRPVITWVGNYEAPSTVRTARILLKRLAARTHWGAVSPTAALCIDDAGMTSADEVTIISNIIDPDLRAVPSREMRPGWPVRIGYLQVARDVKGFDLLPDIVHETAQRTGVAHEWLLFTSRTNHPAWKELDALPNVEVMERTSDVTEVYEQCDMVVSPSRRESFNRVVAEAMTAGRPVVASDLPAVVEVAGEAGVFFPDGDARAGAAAIAKLLDDPELRRTYTERGRNRSTLFHPQRVADQFEGLYRDLAQGAPHPGHRRRAQ